MRRHRVVLFAALASSLTLGTLASFGLFVACNGTSGSLAAGDACHSSTECGPGLVCDFNQSPAICAGNLTVIPDGAPPPPDAPPGTPDARPLPDARPGTPDARPLPDAPPPPPDAAPRPDAPPPPPPDAAPVPDA